ncbi:ScaI family restriction endonuclease [Pseudomonas syringae pv. actinidifoliorum]|uniref:ScaI family restriction endonuclease n=1 Tax=Pseudomonas syringae TaxID=317 RepID=UPI001372E55B|nr:ScaI family restriction endonuclease [Pseudomonas syringae]NAS97442.1 ScaI family restriction endonuclease [Pseudomonas syringae pv. actinidifoliorum]NAT62647.1 ScaI family restriction endonuclease [Pseudomonas syringae pv. actinidifoliorum]
MTTPYKDRPVEEWTAITEELIAAHPLTEEQIVQYCLTAWDDIYHSKIGRKNFKIGEDIFVRPQIIGALLHELIPAEIMANNPNLWQREQKVGDKDVVYLPNDFYSFELKTSSSSMNIYGNRSYAQAPKANKKSKDGYYLTINFEQIKVRSEILPAITVIRFGWLDHTDWIGQTADTGQQARLGPETYKYKFKTLYSKV